MLKTHFFNTAVLTKFYLKKDLKNILIWLTCIFVFTLLIAQYYISTPMTDFEKEALAETLNSPMMILFIGSIPIAKVTTGLLFALEMTLFSVIIIAIMNIFMVTHITRQDEESGRLELIRALPTGRLANSTATIIYAAIVNLSLALLVGFGLGLLDFGEDTLVSGILYGFVLGFSGFMFAMFTLFFAQLFQSNRNAIMSSLGFLGFNFVLRGFTDISNPKLSYISPLSWCYKTEAFANNNWMPVLLMLFMGLIMAGVALYLNSIRDLDGCFIRQKPGKTHASKNLVKPFGLVRRLNRTTLIAWIVGTVVMGLTFGSMFGDLENFFKNNPGLQEMFPGLESADFAKQFMTLTANMFALFIAIPVVTFIVKLYGEEKKSRLENIVSKSLSRAAILKNYLGYSLLTGLLLVVVSTLSVLLAGEGVVELSLVLKNMAIYLPAVLFVLGVSVLLIGVFPKLLSSVWLIIGYGFFITYFGTMFKLPKWAQSISPFYHIPAISASNYDFVPLIILTILGTAFVIVGFMFYKKRDITA